jgi:tetratricopeptide (TPR) repeat protein
LSNRPRELLFALWSQWEDTMFGRAEFKRARRLAAEMRELGDTAGDVPMQVLGYFASADTSFWLGEFTAAPAYFEKALALYDPAHRPLYAAQLSFDAGVAMRINSCRPLACLGHLDQAFFQRDAALEEARRLSDPPTLAFAVAGGLFLKSFVGFEPGSLLQNADELLAIATEYGLGFFRALSLVQRGWWLAALGRTDEGIPLITDGLAGWDQVGFTGFRPWGLARLGDACRIAGQWQDGLAHIAEARRLAEERGDRWFQAETVRLRGDLLLAMGDPAAAEAGYREAIAIAQQQSAKLWELRAAMSLARLWHDQDRHAQAPVAGPGEIKASAFAARKLGRKYLLIRVEREGSARFVALPAVGG